MDAEETKRSFGVVLRRLRKVAGLTQEGLAGEADLQRNYVSSIERGRQQPTLTTIFKLAAALKCPADEIVRLVGVELARPRRRRS